MRLSTIVIGAYRQAVQLYRKRRIRRLLAGTALVRSDKRCAGNRISRGAMSMLMDSPRAAVLARAVLPLIKLAVVDLVSIRRRRVCWTNCLVAGRVSGRRRCAGIDFDQDGDLDLVARDSGPRWSAFISMMAILAEHR